MEVSVNSETHNIHIQAHNFTEFPYNLLHRHSNSTTHNSISTKVTTTSSLLATPTTPTLFLARLPGDWSQALRHVPRRKLQPSTGVHRTKEEALLQRIERREKPLLVGRGCVAALLVKLATQRPTLLGHTPICLEIAFVCLLDLFRAMIWAMVSALKSLFLPISTTQGAQSERRCKLRGSTNKRTDRGTQTLPVPARQQLTVVSIAGSEAPPTTPLCRGGCAFTESLAPICKLWGDDICVQMCAAAASGGERRVVARPPR
ncbi:hypothetical protein GWK47_045600 [Chionoecetes opilio]|uniref:Uncharacterized protein n=1 Tax=Chionoecetes opilio TaxID=41210 RepID=A0A8J5CXI4_CHIOP|nr:hypothetical protein GWK47_045600 [Chionoecetes opilio]